ncbi:FecR family protein [Chitinophaga pinensis]|uniref:Anti-FecI sigma factor, FecR n=1 Tax=Chitinophaga pinensis (strain ATCC 43595 / DSM 2588 / LMG 13176 / NBRC 15968 / NCIMB 11800 / UQM 2034) TaxID=485918 RepID=A0A979FYP8_CHIPD|nr:FecR domain-containing protein [Chitinophaga pinensis]ACU57565.1 anti-FecI sigma factor, FecR [Chitinophaga pinensis DSM 2588]
MPVDPEYIEQLVLEEIAGTISPEDSTTLKDLLENDADAYAIWLNMHRQLTGNHIQSIRENLPNTLPASQIIAVAGKRKRRKILVKTSLSAAAVLLLTAAVCYKLLFPAFQPVSPGAIPSFALKSVMLQLPNGAYFLLGSGQQQFKAGGTNFRETAGKLSWSGGGTESQLATIIVPPDEDYTVQLADGSEVILNADSRMDFPLTFGSKRDIRISGEAYIQVAQKENQPFQVHLPNSTVQVLGTSFNVNTYEARQEQVLLETGAVKMLTADGDVLLHPGQAVKYQPGQVPIINDVDTAIALAWKRGYYTFQATPIKEVSKVMERNYRVKVILDNVATGEQLYSSRLEKQEDLEKFLARLKSIVKIDYQFEKGDSVLHLSYRP